MHEWNRVVPGCERDEFWQGSPLPKPQRSAPPIPGILFLIDVRDVALLCLLHNDLSNRENGRHERITATRTKRGPPEKAGLSRLTGILSGYLSLMRLASACRFSAHNKVTHVGSETGGSIKVLLPLATGPYREGAPP